jgi:hypothetical protein
MSAKTVFGSGCIVLIVILVLNILLGGVCTQYVVDFWGTYIQHKPVTVPFLPCAVAGLFLGEIAIPAAAITWIFSFIL